MTQHELVTKQYLDDVIAIVITELKKISQQSEMPEMLKSKDVKKLLGCSDSTLQSYRDNKQIPFTKIGKTFYYPKESLKHSFAN